MVRLTVSMNSLGQELIENRKFHSFVESSLSRLTLEASRTFAEETKNLTRLRFPFCMQFDIIFLVDFRIRSNVRLFMSIWFASIHLWSFIFRTSKCTTENETRRKEVCNHRIVKFEFRHRRCDDVWLACVWFEVKIICYFSILIDSDEAHSVYHDVDVVWRRFASNSASFGRHQFN